MGRLLMPSSRLLVAGQLLHLVPWLQSGSKENR